MSIYIVYKNYISLGRVLSKTPYAFPIRIGSEKRELNKLKSQVDDDGRDLYPHLRGMTITASPTMNYNYSLFLYYPPENRVTNAPKYYNDLRKFATSCKKKQREIMGTFMDVPLLENPPYIVRPHKHYGGKDFHVAETLGEAQKIAKTLNNPYISSAFEYDKEYRIIFVMGIPTLRYLKVIDKARDEFIPVNHDRGAKFVTIAPDKKPYLYKTEFLQHAQSFLTRYPLDIAAFDVGWDSVSNTYKVFEVNISPQITIPRALTLVETELGLSVGTLFAREEGAMEDMDDEIGF